MLNLTAQKSVISNSKKPAQQPTSPVKVHGPHHSNHLTDLLGKVIAEKKEKEKKTRNGQCMSSSDTSN